MVGGRAVDAACQCDGRRRETDLCEILNAIRKRWPTIRHLFADVRMTAGNCSIKQSS